MPEDRKYDFSAFEEEPKQQEKSYDFTAFEESVEGESGNFTEGSSEPSGEPTTGQSKDGETPSPLVQQPLPVGVAAPEPQPDFSKTKFEYIWDTSEKTPTAPTTEKEALREELKQPELEFNGYYEVNGKPVSGKELRSKLLERDFVNKFQNGVVNVKIENDDHLQQLAQKQYEAGSELGDKWEYLQSGIYRLGAGIEGLPSYIADGIEEVTGLEIDQGAVDIARVNSAILAAKSKEATEKTRQYEEGFFKSLSEGNFGDAFNQGNNMILQSAPVTAYMAVTGGAGIPVSLASSIPVLASSEYATQEVEGLDRGDKLIRATAFGVAEAVGEGVTGAITRSNFNLMKEGYKKLVKQAAKTGDKQAITEIAERSSQELLKNTLKSYSIDTQKEGVSEALTGVAQDLTDDLLGVKELSFQDYVDNALENYAGGVYMGSVLGGGRLSNTAVDIARKQIANPNRREGVIKQIEKKVLDGEVSKPQAQEAISKIQTDGEALDAIPTELQSDKKVFELELEKQQLEKEIEGKDPNLVTPQKERISQIDEELKSIVTPKTEQDAKLQETEATQTEEVTGKVSPLTENLKTPRIAKVGGTFDKALRNEPINESEITEAQEALLEELEVVENSNAPQEIKDRVSAEIEKTFNELENYELTTETKTRTITKAKPTRVVRESVREQAKSPQERLVNREISRVEGTEFTREGFEPTQGATTVLEEQNGKYVLQEFDETGKRTLSQELTIESPSDLELVETIKDENGNAVGATVKNKNNDGEVFSFMDEDLALDFAIEKTKAEVGEMTFEEEQIFEQYEELKPRKDATKERKQQQDREQQREETQRRGIPTEASRSDSIEQGGEINQEAEGEATQEAKQVTPPSEEAKQRATNFGYTAPIQAVRSINKRLGTQYETLEEISDAELDQTTSSRTLEKIKELVGDESAVKTAITDFINDLETRGRVTTTKAANLLKSLNNTSLKSEKQVTKFLEGVSKSFSEAALAEQKKTTKRKLKQAAKKSKGKTTISALAKDLSKLDIGKISDSELLTELEMVAEELQKVSPKLSPNKINTLIKRVQEYQAPQKPQESLEKRVKQNTNKRLNAKTPPQELNAEIERQTLISEYLSSSENIPIEVLQELEEPLPIDFKNRDITSYDVAKKALGDVRRALRSVDKAVEGGVIDTEKANEIRDGIREAAERYKEEIQQQLQAEKQKYDKLKKKTKLPTTPAERYAVEQFLKTEPVDDIAWYSKANDVLESIANEVVPYKEMTDLKSYSAYQSKAAEDIATEVEGKTVKGSIKDVTAQLSKKDASQRERNVLGIRTNLIWDNVYQPMVAAIKQAERLTDSLISDWQKVVVAPSILRKKARQQFNKDMAHIGIVMHYLQEQAMDGAGVSADGVPVGNRDIFGIILGNKKAMDAAGMDADMQKNFLKEQALSNYTKSEIKLLKDAYERLKDPELGYVDVTKISPETSLTESEKKIYDESRKLFDTTSEYQQAANLSRGVDFARRGMYFPTKRKGGSRGSVDKPVNIFTSFTAEAASGKEKTTYSLLTDVGGLEFMLNKVALDHAADVSLDYVFSLQQPVINSLLNSVVRKSNSSNVAMAIKNDYNESLVWQASSISDGLTRILTTLLGARYAKSLLDPLRSAVEIISGTLGASVKTRSLSAIGNIFDKNSWKLLNQLEQDFGIEIADFKDVELNRRSIREGLNEEMVYAKLARKIITVPEYVTAMSLFMPTFRAEFEKLTGQPFDQNKYLNDAQHRKEFQEELKTAVSRGQNFVERVQGSKVKGGTRRRVEYAPKTLVDLFSKESPTSGLVGADTPAGRIIGFFGNYTYREQGEFFTSAKFVINDLLAKGKSVDKAELANAAGVLTNAIIYGYLMSLYYAGRQLVLGDEEEKEEAIKEIEETHTPTGILKSIVNQIGFLGLSKYGKSSRVATIVTLSEIYNLTENEEAKAAVEYVLREQFYVYKPIDLKNKYSIADYAFKEGMPAFHYLSQLTQQGYRDIDEIKEDPDALVALSLAINLTNLGLATGMGTQLPMTPVINDAIKKAKKEKEKPPQQTQREPRVTIK